ncbi:MAG TPA: N(4)-(beta-N-acetylglucosaminyl)-L-asparaginase [Terriglobia bacterium]|jgi:isoaspartyl peptidase/L-asparaginase-like protein (Ntn-hydrolase superfamily)|nr:N(4)-(beta-N-acetylglucosaminyl)-L-asparaginase [Terriglobia bacterium]
MDALDRRDFMKSVAGAAALSAADFATAAAAPDAGPVFLATWPHGKPAVDRAAEVFQSGGVLIDAVEKGINVPEDDPKVTSVGYGGLPNEDGEVELDAALMDGTRHRAGAVCALHSIKNPISVARQVIERTRHTTLAGEGAYQFALKAGFQPMQLLTPDSLQKWLDWRNNPKHEQFWVNPANHDTIGFVATDGKGHVVSGCSTSGLAWKIHGRVGDSPLIGCGVYADDNLGAASATGDGDLMTNYCTSVSIVHNMGRGASPQDACVDLIQHMGKTDPKNRDQFVCVIAINNRGAIGAAATTKEWKFQYALWQNGESKMVDAPVVF